MSRNIRRPSARAATGRRHLSKEMLLPMSRQAVADASLTNHLALAACRKNQGSAYLLNELVRALYLTYYLQQAGFGNADPGLYRRAEAGFEEAGNRALREEVWGVTDEVAMILEQVLAIHDQQLASAALWHIVDARERLLRFAQSDRRSPISDTESDRQNGKNVRDWSASDPEVQ
jgi:hypothetical protein